MKNVHFVPEMRENLFSETSATDQGIEIATCNKFKIFYKNKKELFRCHRRGKAFYMKFELTQQQQETSAVL